MMLTQVAAPKCFPFVISAMSKGDLRVKKMAGGRWDAVQRHRFILKVNSEEKEKLFKLRKWNTRILHKYTLGVTWLSQETAFGFH